MPSSPLESLEAEIVGFAARSTLGAGKHTLIEKPLAKNSAEGRQIVEAARKYNKMVQTGTQSRSSQAIRPSVPLSKRIVRI